MANNGLYFIAELSGNHLGDINRAKSLIDLAIASGANAVKLQTYTPETIAADVMIESGPWAGRSYRDLYKEAALPWEWHEELFDYAEDRGITCFSTPYSLEAVDFLETLNCPIYKIASPEITYLDLIGRAAITHKPLIISTGMASVSEVSRAIRTARSYGAGEITLLKCVSAYPAMPQYFNLRTLQHMKNTFIGCTFGLSDHSLGSAVAVAAVALGARIIEKHFTFSREEGGPDAAFSSEPAEFRAMVSDCQIAYSALGTASYGPTDSEVVSMQYRRALWVVRDIAPNQVITERDVEVLRPAKGIAPENYSRVIGRTTCRAIKAGTPLLWGDLRQI
jgi:N-acetylneuraminate synthase